MELNELKRLQKNADVTNCTLLANGVANFISYHVFHKGEHSLYVDENDNKYFYKNQYGTYELYVERWIQTKDEGLLTMFFYFTPDDKHTYTLQAFRDADYNWSIKSIDVLELQEESIKSGLECTYDTVTVIFNNPNSITVRKGSKEKKIAVSVDKKERCKVLKTKVKAKDGATGLFAFLDQIAEQSKIETSPLHVTYFKALLELL